MPEPVVRRNIMVIGPPGSGKSTLARTMGARFDLRVIHMDQIFWRPGWQERARDQLPPLVEKAVESDGWVCDGNYMSTIDLRAAKADTLIWLDFSRWICVRRVLLRIVKARGTVRPDMTPGCPERFDAGFLRWTWSFPKHSRPALQRFFDEFPRTRFRLTGPAAVKAFMAAAQADSAAP